MSTVDEYLDALPTARAQSASRTSRCSAAER